jgi:hypothetical protein
MFFSLAARALFLLVEGGQQGFRLGVIAEGLADVDEAIDIAGAEDEASSKLKRVFAQAVLACTDGFGAFACARVVRPQEVKQVRFFEAEFAIGNALIVNQKRKGDVVFLAKKAGVIDVAQADGGNSRAALTEMLKVLAQLRDVLLAENSTIMPQKDDDGGRISPQGTECYGLAVHVRQRDGSESRAIAFSHGETLSCWQECVSSGGSRFPGTCWSARESPQATKLPKNPNLKSKACH